MMPAVKAIHVAPFLALCLLACGGGAPPGDGTAPPPVTPAAAPPGPDATIKMKCGACHVPPDPGMHTVAELEPILKKHRDEKRATLTDDEWKNVTDFLAKK